MVFGYGVQARLFRAYKQFPKIAHTINYKPYYAILKREFPTPLQNWFALRFSWNYQNVTNFSISVNGIVITEISNFVTFQ